MIEAGATTKLWPSPLPARVTEELATGVIAANAFEFVEVQNVGHDFSERIVPSKGSPTGTGTVSKSLENDESATNSQLVSSPLSSTVENLVEMRATREMVDLTRASCGANQLTGWMRRIPQGFGTLYGCGCAGLSGCAHQL